MTGSAGCIAGARSKLVLSNKIGSVMCLWSQGRKIGVAGFTRSAHSPIVMTGGADAHGRQTRLTTKINLLESGVACFAGELFANDVQLVWETKLSRVCGENGICCVISAGMAEGAIRIELFLVARLAVFFLGKKNIGGEPALLGGRMAITACNTRFHNVELVGKLNGLGAVLIHACLSRGSECAHGDRTEESNRKECVPPEHRTNVKRGVHNCSENS